MNRILALGLVAGLLGVGAAAAGPPKKAAPQPAPQPAVTVTTRYVSASTPPLPDVDTRPLVWVVDGAGDLRGCSNALTQANMLAGNPVELTAFVWSHGYRRLLLDQTDMNHARVQGARLAGKIIERQMREPGRRTVIVAHSAGSAVALAAGDILPPDTIDRVILLAPSVSTGYDVRPTLRAAREGMDVFCSKKDWVALGFVVKVIGTTDNHNSGAAAGRLGFQPKGSAALQADEAARLRQHFWSPEMAWTGHTGGHHGMHSPAFVQTYLFPLMGARGQY